MIQQLIKYPDPAIRLISGNVRFFNETLKDIIEDMVDTMEANGLEALSAIQIGIQYNVIVLKENGTYTPYVNVRLIKQLGRSEATERTSYYDGISVDVERFEKVTVIYEDEAGEAHHRDVEGALARTFQHQLDYCFGSTFVDRVDKETRQRINDHLAFGLVKDSRGGQCPTVFYRDYFKRAYRYGMLAVLLSFLAPLFVPEALQQTLYMIDKWALFVVVGLIIGYFFYAEYEAKKYKQCTSCQTGNIIGTVVIATVQLLVVSAGVFFWMAP